MNGVNEMNCETCAFWEPKENNQGGRCACKPPVASLVPQQGVAGPTLAVVTYWPETRPDDRCGEWAEGGKPSTLLQS